MRTGTMTYRAAELRDNAALAAVGALIGGAFGLSTLVTPLYLIYQQAFGFSQITLTLIYAAYVIGNMGALLFLGRLSDHIGRRPAALTAIAILIAAAVVFLFAQGTPALYAGRILSGLGIGIASGTGNAWLAELIGTPDKARATTIGTTANFLGLGAAALGAGLLAQYGPWPLQLSFVLYLVVLFTVAALVWFVPETARRSAMRAADLLPKLALPKQIRPQFVAPAIAGFGAMALVGFYAALAPAVLSHDLGIKSHAAAGALFFELAAVVAMVIVATRTLPSRTAMMTSLVLMVPAAAVVVGAQVLASLPAMLATTALVGISAGLGYRGSLQVVNQIAPADQRAGVVSSYFVCGFAGNALPVIGVGVLASFAGETVADTAFAVMLAAFAVVALIFAASSRC